jgi:hypothetical protein
MPAVGQQEADAPAVIADPPPTAKGAPLPASDETARPGSLVLRVGLDLTKIVTSIPPRVSVRHQHGGSQDLGP